MTGVRYDRSDYYTGYTAGLVGRRNIAPPGIVDSLAWYSGFIAGKDVRTSGALRFPRWRPRSPAYAEGRPVPRK
jgi:hypothetical protein